MFVLLLLIPIFVQQLELNEVLCIGGRRGLIKEHSQLARPTHSNIESFFASVMGSLVMLERRESCLADAYL